MIFLATSAHLPPDLEWLSELRRLLPFPTLLSAGQGIVSWKGREVIHILGVDANQDVSINPPSECLRALGLPLSTTGVPTMERLPFPLMEE